jgi:hypothetical protein
MIMMPLSASSDFHFSGMHPSADFIQPEQKQLLFGTEIALQTMLAAHTGHEDNPAVIEAMVEGIAL